MRRTIAAWFMLATLMCVPALLALVLTQSSCQYAPPPGTAARAIAHHTARAHAGGGGVGISGAGDASGAAATQPAGPSSVLMYIKLVSTHEYGFLAHVVGHHDDTVSHCDYDPDNDWWDNPLIVYAEQPMVNPDVTGQVDAPPILGQGASSNVKVHLTLTPHADVAIRSLPKCDGIKGTITVTTSIVADFYDGHWTEMVHENDRKVTFRFDTCDSGRSVQAIGQETRALAPFAVERYTRDQEKWEPRGNWPQKPAAGDWRTLTYGKHAVLEITRYRYDGAPPAGAAQQAHK